MSRKVCHLFFCERAALPPARDSHVEAPRTGARGAVLSRAPSPPLTLPPARSSQVALA